MLIAHINSSDVTATIRSGTQVAWIGGTNLIAKQSTFYWLSDYQEVSNSLMAAGEPNGYNSSICGLLVYSFPSGIRIGDAPVADADKPAACEAFYKGIRHLRCSFVLC